MAPARPRWNIVSAPMELLGTSPELVKTDQIGIVVHPFFATMNDGSFDEMYAPYFDAIQAYLREATHPLLIGVEWTHSSRKLLEVAVAEAKGPRYKYCTPPQDPTPVDGWVQLAETIQTTQAKSIAVCGSWYFPPNEDYPRATGCAGGTYERLNMRLSGVKMDVAKSLNPDEYVHS